MDSDGLHDSLICRILSSRAAVAQSLGVLTVVVAIGFLPALSAQPPDPPVHYTCYDVSSCEDSCDTDVSQLNVEYTGPGSVTFKVDSGDIDDSSKGPFTLSNGQTIVDVLGTPLLGKNGGKIGGNVKFKLFGDQPPLGDDGDEFAKIHASCSQPIFVGMAFGDHGNGYGPFTVAAGTTTVGGEPLLPCLEFVEQQFVTLNDQFNVHPFDLTERLRLCAPTTKTPLSFSDPASVANRFGPHLVSYKLEDALAAPSECGDCSGGLEAIEVIYTGDPLHDPATGPDCVDFELFDSDIVNPGPHKLCNPEILDPAVLAGAPFFPNVVIADADGKLSSVTEAFDPDTGD